MSQSSTRTASSSSTLSSSIRTSSQLTTPTSVAPSVESTSQSKLSYAPGIGEIVTRSVTREEGSSPGLQLNIEDHSIPFEEFSLQIPRLSPPDRSLSPRQPVTSTDGWDILNPKSYVSSRETGIRLVQNVSQNLGQIRDGMYTTIKEYFNHRVYIHLWEVKSFRYLRQSLNQLVDTLEQVERSLSDHQYFPDDLSVKLFLHTIKSSLNAIVSEGFCILQAWNRREAGQKLGEPLTGKEWRLRANLIHGDDARLANMRKTVVQAEATVLQELKQLQPNVLRKVKLDKRKGLGWLDYIRPVCSVLGRREHQDHQMEQILISHGGAT